MCEKQVVFSQTLTLVVFTGAGYVCEKRVNFIVAGVCFYHEW